MFFFLINVLKGGLNFHKGGSQAFLFIFFILTEHSHMTESCKGKRCHHAFLVAPVSVKRIVVYDGLRHCVCGL